MTVDHVSTCVSLLYEDIHVVITRDTLIQTSTGQYRTCTSMYEKKNKDLLLQKISSLLTF